MIRPDQENLNSLLAHIEQMKFGTTIVKITGVGGFIAGWEEIETKRGHKAPLKKIEKEPDADV